MKALLYNCGNKVNRLPNRSIQCHLSKYHMQLDAIKLEIFF